MIFLGIKYKLKNEARDINNKEFGEIQDIQGNYLLVQKGIIDKETFYIPKDLVELCWSYLYDLHFLSRCENISK